MIRINDNLNNLNNSNPVCEVCYNSKIHQLPYKKSETRKEHLLGMIHSDICGPFSTASLGAKYFVTFINDKSYIHIKPLKNRSDVLTAFKQYKAQVEKETGYKIKRLRTDNGKEYLIQ